MSDANPDEDCRLAGEIISDLDPFRFSARLRQSNINSSVRESSHYATGNYIRISENEELDFTLERISADTYLARAFANHKETLFQVVSRLSLYLGTIGVTHYFEIYDKQGQLIRSLSQCQPES